MALFKQEKVKKTEIPPLLNPPLVEAIFEIRWNLKRDAETQRLRDVSYPIMCGQLYERLKKDFPLIEDLPSTQAHPEATPFVVRHRMRKQKDSWPVLQVGPGIVTINEVKGYSWKSFQSLILRVMGAIEELYPKNDFPLNFIKAEVRYINGIPFNGEQEHPLAFLADKLHVKLELDEELFAGGVVGEKPLDVGMNVVYPLSRPVGNLLLAVNLGQVDNKPAFLVQSLIQSFGESVAQDKAALETWLTQAHDVAEHSFHTFCKGNLMSRFCEAGKR
ncbi:MAG TPA: TIGR04255 family protein [Chlamydiales bacterium]|jgi:uncharacterized protein (TIGR04255 family)